MLWDELDDSTQDNGNENFLGEDGEEDENDTIESNHSYGEMFSSEASSDEAVTYTVLQDFVPTRVGELALAVGDRVKVTDDSDDQWWVGKINKLMGRFPAKNVGTSI